MFFENFFSFIFEEKKAIEWWLKMGLELENIFPAKKMQSLFYLIGL